MSAAAMYHQNRVKVTLKSTILEFFKGHINAQFTGAEFLTFVHFHHSCAPNSPLRIMQVLKKDRAINYRVVEADYLNRQQSVYEVLPVVELNVPVN
jgi:hypothetical protein